MSSTKANMNPRYVVLLDTPFTQFLSRKIKSPRVSFQANPHDQITKAAECFGVSNYNHHLRDEYEFTEQVLHSSNYNVIPWLYRDKLTDQTVRRHAGLKVIFRFAPALLFARLCATQWGNETRFIFPAPLVARRALAERGYKISWALSELCWRIESTRYLTRGLTACIRSAVAIVKDYLTLPKTSGLPNDHAPILWLSMSRTFFENGPGTLNLSAWIKEKRISFLKQNHITFLQSEGAQTTSSSDDHVLVGKNFIRWPGRSTPPLARTLAAIGQTVFTFFSLLASYFFLIEWKLLLGEDLAMLPRMELWYESIKPKALVWTTNFVNAPLWTSLAPHYQCDRWLVFYSTHSSPHKQLTDPPDTQLALYRYVTSDHFAVWNHHQKQWLEDLGFNEKQIEVCGPIIFAARPKRTPRHAGTPTRLVIFDRAPSSCAHSIRYGVLSPYYTLKNTTQILRDIVEESTALFGHNNVELYLKSSLRDSTTQSAHWDYIHLLAQQYSNFQVIAPTQSALSAIYDKDIVISAPFTSTSELAPDFGIPSAFYDPTALLVAPNGLNTDKLPLLSGRPALHAWLTMLIKLTKTRA